MSTNLDNIKRLKYRKAESRRAIYRSPAVFILFTTQCYAKKWGNKIDNAFMLNATIRNGKLNGELNGDNGKVDGELNPALLYLNKSELAVYRTFQSIRHSTKI